MNARGSLAIAIACTACAMVAAGPAEGATVTHKLSGGVSGDDNARVSIQVVVKGGKPVKVKKLAYEGLDTFCDQDEEVGFETPAGERSGSAGKNVGPGVEQDRSFRWVSYPTDPSRQVNVVGKVKRRGKKVTGLLEVFYNESPACKAKGSFTATK